MVGRDRAKYEITIKPRSQWWHLNLKELWLYRELAFIFSWRDIKVRYKQTAVGILWAGLQPVLTVVIFSFFFGKLANIPSDDIPYPVFAFMGIVFWNYFSISLTNASNTIIDNESIVKKVYFPRLILPISSAVTPIVDLMIALTILVVMLFYYGFVPSLMSIVIVPILLITSFLAASGLGLFLASINLKYRDVRYALPFFIQMLMYLTPVIYPSSLVGEKYQWILALNPMTGVIETARAGILGVHPIDYQLLGIAVVIAIFMFVFGILNFKRAERFFADIA